MIAVERHVRHAPGLAAAFAERVAGAVGAETGALRRDIAPRTATCLEEESEPTGCNEFPNESGLVGVAKGETSGASHSR